MSNNMERGYKKEDLEQIRFYEVPKLLMENEKYDKMSFASKLVYGILKDRFRLSKKNEWYDEDGYIYFIFTGDELGEVLKTTRQTARKYIKELAKYDLIVDKRMGNNKPNRLYMLKPELREKDKYIPKNKEKNTDETVENTGELKNLTTEEKTMLKNQTSECEEIKLPDVKKVNGNDTDFRDTDFSDTDNSFNSFKEQEKNEMNELNEIYIKCELNSFEEKDKITIESVIDDLYFTQEFVSKGKNKDMRLNNWLIRKKLSTLNPQIVNQFLMKLKERVEDQIDEKVNPISNPHSYSKTLLLDKIASHYAMESALK